MRSRESGIVMRAPVSDHLIVPGPVNESPRSACGYLDDPVAIEPGSAALTPPSADADAPPLSRCAGEGHRPACGRG
jgi:hypothetical protein